MVGSRGTDRGQSPTYPTTSRPTVTDSGPVVELRGRSGKKHGKGTYMCREGGVDTSVTSLGSSENLFNIVLPLVFKRLPTL